MFDSLFNFGVKELTGMISGHTDMDAGDANDATTGTIFDTIKSEVLNGNEDVKDLVKTDGSDIDEDSPAVSSIIAKAAPIISEQLGIPEGIATMIISKALPFIIKSMNLDDL